MESIFYRLRAMIDHLRHISPQALADLLTTRATSANISLTKGKDTLCQMGWERDRLKLSKNDQDDMLDN